MTSKFVILLMVAIIGFSSLLAYETSVNYNSSPFTSRAPAVSYGYYLSGGNATIVTYSHDIYGQPYDNLNLYLLDQGLNYAAVSGLDGFANVTLPYSATGTTSVVMNYTYTLFGTTLSSPKITVTISPLLQFTGYSISTGLVDSMNNSNIGFLVMYVGPNGSLSEPVNTFVGTYSPGETSNALVANATDDIAMSGFTVMSVFPQIPSSLLNQSFALAIKNQSGAYVHPTIDSAYFLGRVSAYVPITQTLLQNVVLSGIGTTLGLLIPILGIFTSYLTYGKDKVTGVLESVMKRPVTKQGIITSRFTANAFSIGISVILSMIIGDLIIIHFFGTGLSLYFSLFFIWAYMIEGLAFLSLMYLFAHIVKTQSFLLGIAISMFIIMDMLWLIIPAALLGGLGIPRASSTYILGNVAFGYASPAGYGSLVQFYFTDHIGFLSNVSVNPAAYGVTEFYLILAGLLWVLVPYAITYYLARNFD